MSSKRRKILILAAALCGTSALMAAARYGWIKLTAWRERRRCARLERVYRAESGGHLDTSQVAEIAGLLARTRPKVAEAERDLALMSKLDHIEWCRLCQRRLVSFGSLLNPDEDDQAFGQARPA